MEEAEADEKPSTSALQAPEAADGAGEQKKKKKAKKVGHPTFPPVFAGKHA